jgi:hypothetical protein
MSTPEPLPGGSVAGVVRVGDAETVCHRDPSPRNTVYRDTPAGEAAPGRR